MENEILKQLSLFQHNPGACFGGDDWMSQRTSEITSINPATGQPLASVNAVDAPTYHVIADQAQKAFTRWRKVPAPERGQVVREIADELRKHKDALGSLISMEMGKIKQEGDGEVQEMIDIADFAVGLSRQLYGLTMHSERPDHRMYEQWHPVGVCGIISAFNFPMAVWSWNAFIAAVCGDVCIWKPSPKVPLCAIAVQNICNKVLERHHQKGVFNLVIGTNEEIGETFIHDTTLPLISFTGSSKVGQYVASVVAGRFGKSILELGGNNAVIIDESADLSLAIPSVVFGAVGTAGQRCTSTRRVIIHEAVYEKFKSNLIAAYEKVTIGNPLDPEVLMGPLIDQMAVDHYQQALHTLTNQGGQIITGNQVLDREGFFVTPTIVEVEHDWELVHSETFAPILYLIKVASIEEGIKVNNEVQQGLSSAIFTDSLQHAELFLSHVGSDCGIANVNIGTSGAEIGGAFGGEKATGGGRESGSDAWKGYMRRQTNTINWGREIPLAQGIRFDIG
jgi:aldehyde dehydrogenase (NAD+)